MFCPRNTVDTVDVVDAQGDLLGNPLSGEGVSPVEDVEGIEAFKTSFFLVRRALMIVCLVKPERLTFAVGNAIVRRRLARKESAAWKPALCARRIDASKPGYQEQ